MTKHRRRRISAATPRQRRRAPRRSPRPRRPLSEKKNIAALARELNEAREQQAAASEVLRVIASSPGDLQPVFQAMLANAIRLCQAKFGSLFLREGEGFSNVCNIGERSDYTEWYQREPMMVLRDHHPRMPLAQVAESKAVTHIADLAAEQAYIERDPRMIALVEAAGARSLLAVPMLKENELPDAIAIYRHELRPLTVKQVDLVSNFASQAVIAIANTRLLNELRQRTDDLSESLEQQTAMSEVLRVISSSPTDLAPVFDTILTNATRLCEGNFAALWQYDGEGLVGAALHGVSPGFAELCRRTKLRLGPEGPGRKSALERRTVHIADITVEPGSSPVLLQHENARTVLAVPLLREKNLVGVISIWRREVRPFTDKQIELVTSFANQAVIAIENARLLNELRQRTDDLSEALEQQTATA